MTSKITQIKRTGEILTKRVITMGVSAYLVVDYLGLVDNRFVRMFDLKADALKCHAELVAFHAAT